MTNLFLKKILMEDIELIQNIKNGDKKSENNLYCKYKTFLKNYLRKKNKENFYSEFDIEDDVSEILMRVFCNLHSYDFNKSKFSSWVISIANNYVIDKWRYSLNNKNVTISLDTIYNYSSNYTDFEKYNDSNLICFETTNTINNIFSDVSCQDSKFFEMKYVLGYSYCEIGKEFNMSSNTISNRVNYIKTKIKNCIINE